MKKTGGAAPHRRFTKSERARMVQIGAVLEAYGQARNRHQANYPADLVAAQIAAADLARTLGALADLEPTRRELLGLAHQWESTRSRHAVQLTAGSTAVPNGAGQGGQS
jgi:hypothetical protein